MCIPQSLPDILIIGIIVDQDVYTTIPYLNINHRYYRWSECAYLNPLPGILIIGILVDQDVYTTIPYLIY